MTIHGRAVASLPWWAKIIGKCIFSRLPIPYRAWKSLRLFEHGDMDHPERAWANFVAHAESARMLLPGLRPELQGAGAEGAGPTVMELGPGDSLFSAQIARALGASRTILVDVGAFASIDMARYRAMGSFLAGAGFLLPPQASAASTVHEMLRALSSEYLVEGVLSLKRIPSGSVDYCFSNAVLEHVDVDDFGLLAQELHRTLRPGAHSIHRVDLRDHLGGGLNNLRFSRRAWEGRLLKPSGFYTNRLRRHQILDSFRKVGFQVECIRTDRWDALPIDRRRLAEEFRLMPEDELLVQGFDLLATRI